MGKKKTVVRRTARDIIAHGYYPRKGGKVHRFIDKNTGKTFYRPEDYKRKGGRYK